MTQQESLKKRIRARMAKTGERYTAARRNLLAETRQHQRTWTAQPEMSDEAVRSGTGKSWDEWCDLIEAWQGDTTDHTAIAAHLLETYDVSQWWAQTITVGYERITGLRLPYQRPDGTFTASKSRTVKADAALLRTMLLDDAQRADLFPDIETQLKSRASAKAIRIAIGPGVAVLGLEAKPDGRTKVTVGHEKLPTFDDVAEWKFYWTDWLDAIDG